MGNPISIKQGKSFPQFSLKVEQEDSSKNTAIHLISDVPRLCRLQLRLKLKQQLKREEAFQHPFVFKRLFEQVLQVWAILVQS